MTERLGPMWTSRGPSFTTEMWEGRCELVTSPPEPSREVHWSEPLLAWIDDVAAIEMCSFDRLVQQLVAEALGYRQAALDATRQRGQV